MSSKTQRPTDRDLFDWIEAVRVRERDVWRHKKTGKAYRVVAVALVEDTQEPVVVYQRIDAHAVCRPTWTRPAPEFRDRFELIQRAY